MTQTSPDLQAPPIRDEAAALSAAAGNPSLARELLRAFLQELPEHLATLRASWQRGDWRGLRDAAHRLHGATAYCGVPALKRATQQLELAAPRGDAEVNGHCLANLEVEAQRLLEYVQRAP